MVFFSEVSSSPDIRNKRAYFDYEILQEFEAGLVLEGAEVKSLRAGQGSLAGAFVSVRNGEAFVHNFQITEWKFSQYKLEPLRKRKLLLHKREITRLQKKLDEQGLTVIPLKIFWSRGKAKLKIGLARGKKKYDKRETIKKRELDRQAGGKMKI